MGILQVFDLTFSYKVAKVRSVETKVETKVETSDSTTNCIKVGIKSALRRPVKPTYMS